MVVDDDDDTRRLVVTILQTKYEVVEACNGLDALTKVEYSEPDFIVMDVSMPLMDGFQACQAITRNPKYSATRVMFLSAMDDKEHIKKGYESGGSLYLTKPIDPMRLLKNVDLYFSESPPSRRPKRMTLEDIRKMEESMEEEETEQNVHDIDTVRDFRGDTEPESVTSKTPSLEEREEVRDAVYGRYSKPRVMVIDDDPDIIALIRMSLKDRVEVVWADDSATAIEKIAMYEPDMLFLDIMMPKFSGYQLLQVIRRNQYYKELPVIIVSAKSSQRDIAYARQMGATEYITKPFSPDQLVRLTDSLASKPGFKVKKKKLLYQTIIASEQPTTGSPFELMDDEQRFIKKVDDGIISQFIKKHMMDEEEKGESSDESGGKKKK